MPGKNEEDDVLNFLDSLPSDQKTSDATQQDIAGSNNSGNSADILDFLDELAQENTTASISLKPAKNVESVAPNIATATPGGEIETASPQAPAEAEPQGSAPTNTANGKQGASAAGAESSASSAWWGASGSKQLNAFWGSASHVVGDLSKTAHSTYQDISKVANDQLKDLNLLDKEEYEKLPEKIKARGEALSKNVHLGDTKNSIDKVGGLFSSFVSTINEQIVSTAKTINAHDELLKIHIINDQLTNFKYVDYLAYNKFHRVIDQVEGSIDLEVANSENFSKLLGILDLNQLTAKDSGKEPKKIEFFRGSTFDAEKLAFAKIDEGIKTLMQLKKQEKEDQKQRAESDDNIEEKQQATGNVSHIFLNIIPVVPGESAQMYSSDFEEIVNIDESSTESFQFLIVLKDLEHKFSIVTKSQPFPLKWARWLITNSVSGKKTATKESEAGEESEVTSNSQETLSDNDDIEPASWVGEWIKDGLGVSFGVLAQSYVTKRMGF